MIRTKKIIIVFFILLSMSYSFCLSAQDKEAPEFIKENNAQNTSDIEIYSKFGILIDLDSSNILYSKNADAKVYPASTTKVLTAILAIENLNLSDSVVVSKSAINLPYGSSNAALKEGEVVSVENLLYCLMLKSGNDAANVLAEAVSGNMDDFISLMNEKARALGCVNSHFENPHGYHEDSHYTTPRDLAKIFAYALKNNTFLKICSTRSYSIGPTNKTENIREYINSNRLILTKEDSYLSHYYKYCICGKTGYTEEAGRTFLAYAKKGDYNLVIGTFDVMDVKGTDGRYLDAITLFDYGFNNFEKKTLVRANDYSYKYKDYNKNLAYTFNLKEDIVTLAPKNHGNYIFNISDKLEIDSDRLKKIDDKNFTGNEEIPDIGTVTFTFNDKIFDFNHTAQVTLKNVENFQSTNSIISIITSVCYWILFACALLILLKMFLFILNKSNSKISKSRRATTKDAIETKMTSRKRSRSKNSISRNTNLRRRRNDF